MTQAHLWITAVSDRGFARVEGVMGGTKRGHGGVIAREVQDRLADGSGQGGKGHCPPAKIHWPK